MVAAAVVAAGTSPTRGLVGTVRLAASTPSRTGRPARSQALAVCRAQEAVCPLRAGQCRCVTKGTVKGGCQQCHYDVMWASDVAVMSQDIPVMSL